jgi:hypothetical protein
MKATQPGMRNGRISREIVRSQEFTMFFIGKGCSLGLSVGACKMAQWILTCKDCYQSFTYGENLVFPKSYDPAWAPKPDFPEGGLGMPCPTCKKTSTYQRYELMYSRGQHTGKNGGNPKSSAFIAGPRTRPITASARAAIQTLVKSPRVIVPRDSTLPKN